MRSVRRSIMDVMSDPTPGVGVPVAEPVERTRHAPRYKVFVHNDDSTPMVLVVHVLRGIFGLEQEIRAEISRRRRA